MGLLSTEVEVCLCSRNIKRYEGLGYEIPRSINKYGKLTVKQNTKIMVKVDDLPCGSNVIVDVICDNCNKVYQLSYYNYNKTLHDGKSYCINCAPKVFISGENHYLWDCNKTEQERILGRRTLDGYTDFIKNVLERDKYTCLRCNCTGSNLNVHHLNGYDWFVDGRLDTKNAVTLCDKCHKNFHLLYGKGNNTKEQFEEWMGFALEDLKDCNGNINTARKVYCVEDNTIYNGIYDFCNKNNIKNTFYAYMVCNNNPYASNKKHKVIAKSVHGLHILWYDEYVNMSKYDINKYLEYVKQNDSCIKVLCVNDQKVFNSISEASKFYKVSSRDIKNCCEGIKKYHKKKDGTILTWQYCNDYLKDKKMKKIDDDIKTEE